MNDLRSEIKAAFEEEQAANPPIPGLRDSLVHAAGTQESRGSAWQWAAAGAALLIAALVVAGLLATRFNERPLPSRPQPSASPAGDYGPPQAGVPLIYVGDPNHPGWYIGFDWTGRPRGTIKLEQAVDQNRNLVQAPDGSAFLVAPFKGLGGQFYDRLGRPIPDAMAGGTFQSEIWSDDSRQLCGLFKAPNQWGLGVISKPGGGMAPTNVVALDSSNLSSGIIAIRIAACSPANDRAVLVYNYFGRPSEVWIVRLSDGAILRHASYPAGQLGDIAASADGSLLAYNSNLSTGYLMGGAAATTVIRHATDDSLLTTLDPSMAVVAFSADDTRALVTTTPQASGVATHLALVDVETGAVLWRYDTADELAGYFVNPTDGSFAVMMQRTSDQATHPSVVLVIVHADGSSIAVRGEYVRP